MKVGVIEMENSSEATGFVGYSPPLIVNAFFRCASSRLYLESGLRRLHITAAAMRTTPPTPAATGTILFLEQTEERRGTRISFRKTFGVLLNYHYYANRETARGSARV